jgi:hypothetical protein
VDQFISSAADKVGFFRSFVWFFKTLL